MSERLDPGRDEALADLRRRMRERMEQRRKEPPTRVPPSVEPRSDEVFAEGAHWLDENG